MDVIPKLTLSPNNYQEWKRRIAIKLVARFGDVGQYLVAGKLTDYMVTQPVLVAQPQASTSQPASKAGKSASNADVSVATAQLVSNLQVSSTLSAPALQLRFNAKIIDGLIDQFL